MKLLQILGIGLLTLIRSVATQCSYPTELNSTDPTSFYINVFSFDNSFYNGRNLQLRNVNGKQVVVVDATSPVLLTQLRDGIFYSQGYDISNTPYDLGPVSYLQNVTSTKSYSKQEFYFQNATKTHKATNGFQFEIPSESAVYQLYHQVGNDIVNGWIICQQKDYWQLFYYTYLSNPGPLGSCNFIALRVSRKYLLNNVSDCSLGYYSSICAVQLGIIDGFVGGLMMQ
jgi:hypothetical protein